MGVVSGQHQGGLDVGLPGERLGQLLDVLGLEGVQDLGRAGAGGGLLVGEELHARGWEQNTQTSSFVPLFFL